jgi:hypothetical protein
VAVVFDLDDLRRMSPLERQELRQALAVLDEYDPRAAAAGNRRRRILLIAVIVCCLALAAWIGILATTLPRYYTSGGWRGAWVGFDIAELAAFAATGWAAYKRRQVLIICLIVLATLLCCDAWFDVLLDARTKGFIWSLLSALLIELPLAAIAVLGARRLLRMTNAVMLRYRGLTGPVPPLVAIPLMGVQSGRPFGSIFAEPAERWADTALAHHAAAASELARRAPPDGHPPEG